MKVKRWFSLFFLALLLNFSLNLLGSDLEDLKPLCSICHDSLSNDQPTRTLRCHHTHHADCIEDWFEFHDTCPDCRSNRHMSFKTGDSLYEVYLGKKLEIFFFEYQTISKHRQDGLSMPLPKSPIKAALKSEDERIRRLALNHLAAKTLDFKNSFKKKFYKTGGYEILRNHLLQESDPDLYRRTLELLFQYSKESYFDGKSIGTKEFILHLLAKLSKAFDTRLEEGMQSFRLNLLALICHKNPAAIELVEKNGVYKLLDSYLKSPRLDIYEPAIGLISNIMDSSKNKKHSRKIFSLKNRLNVFIDGLILITKHSKNSWDWCEVAKIIGEFARDSKKNKETLKSDKVQSLLIYWAKEGGVNINIAITDTLAYILLDDHEEYERALEELVLD